MKELRVLFVLAEMGALENNIAIKTSDLGNKLKIPQQTVSRILLGLIKNGSIRKVKGIRGYVVRITPEGKKQLENLKSDLDVIFKKTQEISISGKVLDGLSDGKYYMSLSEYREQFEKKLGFKPYSGTLNIRLDMEDRNIKERIKKMDGILIEGFVKNNRVYGSLKCFKCMINGIEGSIIIPERSHYGSEILELISPFKLRKKLNLKNGSKIDVEVRE